MEIFPATCIVRRQFDFYTHQIRQMKNKKPTNGDQVIARTLANNLTLERQLLKSERGKFQLEQKLVKQAAKYEAKLEKQAMKSKAENDALSTELATVRRLHAELFESANAARKERLRLAGKADDAA